MNAIRRWTGRRDGAALFTTMMIILALSALMAVTYKGSVQSVFTAHKLADRSRAQAVAEAGAHKAYSILETNFNARLSDAAFPLTSYGGGTFDVTVTPLSNNVAVVSSLGRYGLASEQVIVDVKNYGPSVDGTGGSGWTAYSILCGGSFDFGGCGNISSPIGMAYLHANGPVTIRGDASVNLNVRSSVKITISNNVNLDGSVRAPVLSYTPSKVVIQDGATVGAVPNVAIPDVDLTPYCTWATAHGESYNGFNASGGTYTPNGGVMWVNGDVQLSSHTVINGSIVATGNITIGGDSDVNAGPSGIAAASRDGNISYSSSGVTHGLIYAKTGGFTQTANGQIEGQIVVKGNISKGGNSDEMLYVETVLDTPGDDGSTADVIGISAWQK